MASSRKKPEQEGEGRGQGREGEEPGYRRWMMENQLKRRLTGREGLKEERQDRKVSKASTLSTSHLYHCKRALIESLKGGR